LPWGAEAVVEGVDEVEGWVAGDEFEWFWRCHVGP